MKKSFKGQVLILAVSAMLCALSVVFGKFLMIPIGNSNRISLGFLPVALASLSYGPAVGTMVGVSADILGCVLAGMPINPALTFAFGLMGLIPGLFHRVRFLDLRNKSSFLSLGANLLLTHAIGDIILKTAALRWYYRTPYSVLALRIPIALATAAVESAILFILFSRREFTAPLIKAGGGKICGTERDNSRMNSPRRADGRVKSKERRR